MNKRKQKILAFTLAEVLIVLGIVGILASAVLPTRIVKYQKQVTAERLKKSYITLSNALKMSEVENGDLASWDLTSDGAFDTYISPYIKKVKSCKNCQVNYKIYKRFNGESCNDGSHVLCNRGLHLTQNIIYTHDGMVFGTSDHANLGTSSVATLALIQIEVDINGTAKPNRYNKDIFRFELSSKYGLKPFGYGIGAENWNRIGTNCNAREMITNSSHGCNKNAIYGLWCTMKIYCDGWQIKDDYPW